MQGTSVTIDTTNVSLSASQVALSGAAANAGELLVSDGAGGIAAADAGVVTAKAPWRKLWRPGGRRTGTLVQNLVGHTRPQLAPLRKQ